VHLDLDGQEEKRGVSLAMIHPEVIVMTMVVSWLVRRTGARIHNEMT